MKKAFTLLELLVVMIIIWILSAIVFNLYNWYNNGKDYTPWINKTFYTNILKNDIVYSGNNDIDIPIYCKNNWCTWDNNNRCITDWYDFNSLSNKTEWYKKMFSHIVEYEICPKYKKDNNGNEQLIDKNDQKFHVYAKYKVGTEERKYYLK